MKNNNTAIRAAVVAALALPTLGIAADSHRCAAVIDDAPRLACYDSAFGKPVRPAGVASTSAPQVVSPAPVSVAAAPVAPPAKPAKPKDEPVSARIVAVGQLSNDRFAVTLDNGQLWMQLERDVGAEVRVGDSVILRPAMLGSWMLETRGGIRTRVRLAR